MVNPFAYEEYRKDKIRQKIEETRAQRVQLKVSIVLAVEFTGGKNLVFILLLLQRNLPSISEFFHRLLVFSVYFICLKGGCCVVLLWRAALQWCYGKSMALWEVVAEGLLSCSLLCPCGGVFRWAFGFGGVGAQQRQQAES